MSSPDQINVAPPHSNNNVLFFENSNTAFLGQAQNLDVGRARLGPLHLRRDADAQADALAVVDVPPLINERVELLGKHRDLLLCFPHFPPCNGACNWQMPILCILLFLYWQDFKMVPALALMISLFLCCH